MATSLARSTHLDAYRLHGVALAERAADVGLAAAVPSCPDWTVADLVAHLAMVHRWAVSKIVGDDGFTFRDADEIRRSEPDLLAFYLDGHRQLAQILEDADDGLEAPVFLDNAEGPIEFWVRRQAHETTIHAVDSLAAVLGRLPTTAEVALEPDYAADGIDELVRGFLPRSTSALFQGEPYVIGVKPSDSVRAWSIQVGPELEAQEGLADGAVATFVGTSAELYLGLWNRGDELSVDGDDSILTRWREAQSIAWG